MIHLSDRAHVMFLFTVICITTVVSVNSSTVATTTGPVRGKLNHDHGVYYYSYQGIPYAENPEGALRFKAPVPKKPWADILDVTQQGPVCPQPVMRHQKWQMSEDCLTINIYVPANRTQKLLPVFAFIHGGGFKMLSGYPDQYGPQFYLQRDIVFVSINHRLGALGFLSLQNENAPGNAGLKDIILALMWIKANIERFGGDNLKVTIGGNSSGAAAAHYLMLTDKTAGLFQQAFLSSGSAISYRFVQKTPKKNALALAEKLGLPTEDLRQLIKNLSLVDAFAVVDAQESILEKERNEMRPFSPFVPSVEPESKDAIITKQPIDIVKSGMPQKVPILTGLNSLEGVYMWAALKNTSLKTLSRKFVDCIPADLEYPKCSTSYHELVKSIGKLYFGDTNLTNFTLHNFLELLSDTQYTFNYDYWIRLYKEQNSSNILYYYMFDFDGDLNWAKIKFNVSEVSGTAHADDLGYQFVTKATDHLLDNIDERMRRMMDVMMTLFTNFMKYGNPTPEDYQGIKWPLYDSTRSYLLLTDNPTVGTHGPNARRFDFWHDEYRKYDQYITAGGREALDDCLIEEKRHYVEFKDDRKTFYNNILIMESGILTLTILLSIFVMLLLYGRNKTYLFLF